MKHILSGLFALAWLVAMVAAPVQAGTDTIAYKPGAVEKAIANGETILIDYKATW